MPSVMTAAMVCRTFHLNDFFNVGDALAMAGFHFLAEGAAITVGIEDAHDSGNPRFDGPAARIAGGGHGAHGGTMVRTIAGDNFFAASEELGHFHGVFIGFGPAEGEECFGEAGDFGEFLAEEAARFGGETGTGEAEFIDLFLDGFEHFGMLVADIEVDELRAEVQPAMVVAVPKPNALTALHVDQERTRPERTRRTWCSRDFLAQHCGNANP